MAEINKGPLPPTKAASWYDICQQADKELKPTFAEYQKSDRQGHVCTGFKCQQCFDSVGDSSWVKIMKEKMEKIKEEKRRKEKVEQEMYEICEQGDKEQKPTFDSVGERSWVKVMKKKMEKIKEEKKRKEELEQEKKQEKEEVIEHIKVEVVPDNVIVSNNKSLCPSVKGEENTAEPKIQKEDKTADASSPLLHANLVDDNSGVTVMLEQMNGNNEEKDVAAEPLVQQKVIPPYLMKEIEDGPVKAEEAEVQVNETSTASNDIDVDQEIPNMHHEKRRVEAVEYHVTIEVYGNGFSRIDDVRAASPKEEITKPVSMGLNYETTI